MANPPQGKGGPEEGTPEYNWLYGQGGKGGPPPSGDETRQVPVSGSRPDETRKMPAVPRGERGRGAAAASGASGAASARPRSSSRPASPPPGGGSRPPSSRSRRPRFRAKWLLVLLLLWLVFLVAVPFWAWTKVSKVNAEPAGERPGEQPGTTYLLVGSDSRDDLTPAERKELGTGGSVGRRTDTIMLLHVGSGPNLLMSIPRDSIVDIPGNGTGKINAAYAYGGPRLMTRTVEQNTGIRVDHYVEIGFGGFVGVVDALGGIEICPTQAMKDPAANLNIKKGCQEADGKKALGYARSRKTSNLGDLERAKHQREVVSAVGSKAVSPWSFINPVRYWNLNMAAADSVAVSEGSSVISMGRFAWAMTRVDGETGLTCGVPVADFAVNWDEQRSQALFQRIIEDDTDSIPKDLCTASGFPPGAGQG